MTDKTKKNPAINSGCSEKLYPDFMADMVNKNLSRIIASYKNLPEVLKNSIKYSMENGGKRLRPVLCIMTAASLGKKYSEAMPVACAIEFVHTYSLIHDDLPPIDDDDYRRGKPTSHKVFGEDIAILTGDALFAEAFNIILKHQKSSTDIKLKLLEELSFASGAEGMVAGQIIDVFYSGKKITEKLLENMHEKKTAKLIIASVRCGAIIGQANEKIIEKLTAYAYNIGLAFQITDDIIDIEATTETAGKTTGKDIVQKKNTFASVYGVEKSKKIAELKINSAIGAIKDLDIDKKWLINIAEFILNRKK